MFSVQNKLDLNILKSLLAVSLHFLFIEISFDSQPTDELSNEFLLNLVQKVQEPSAVEEIENQNMRITFKEIGDEDNCDYVIEVLSLISTIVLREYDSQILFDGIAVNIFDLFSYIYTALSKTEKNPSK